MGCLGHSDHTAGMRRALDAGRPEQALHALERTIAADRFGAEGALLELDRATLLQALGRHLESSRSYETADKSIDLQALSRNAGDEVATATVSGSVTRYAAPAHERLLINPLNALNYLERGDAGGACVEARRHTVFTNYLADRGFAPSELWGFGSAIAGFSFEVAQEPTKAKLYYGDAASSGIDMAPFTRSTSLTAEQGELLVVVGDGRVPHLEPTHAFVDGHSLTYPGLAPYHRPSGQPELRVGNQRHALVPVLHVGDEVVRAYRAVEPALIAEALTRKLTRDAVAATGATVAKHAKDKEVRAAAALVGLFAWVSLFALDTADTRSWETLPARFSVLRLPLDPGTHEIRLSSRGHARHVRVSMPPRGWATVTLFALN